MCHATFVSLIFLCVLGVCCHANAEPCWQYGTRYAVCGPGCGPLETTSCGWGCISGECYSDGGSGTCCGKMYYSAVIYPDGGTCGECGNIRSHRFKHSAQHQLLGGDSPAIWWATSRGLVWLTNNISFHPARQAFVLNKCAHAYGVLIEKDYPVVVGGRL